MKTSPGRFYSADGSWKPAVILPGTDCALCQFMLCEDSTQRNTSLLQLSSLLSHSTDVLPRSPLCVCVLGGYKDGTVQLQHVTAKRLMFASAFPNSSNLLFQLLLSSQLFVLFSHFILVVIARSCIPIPFITRVASASLAACCCFDGWRLDCSVCLQCLCGQHTPILMTHTPQNSPALLKLKGIIHLKLKSHPFSVHHDVGGGSGAIF